MVDILLIDFIADSINEHLFVCFYFKSFIEIFNVDFSFHNNTNLLQFSIDLTEFLVLVLLHLIRLLPHALIVRVNFIQHGSVVTLHFPQLIDHGLMSLELSNALSPVHLLLDAPPQFLNLWLAVHCADHLSHCLRHIRDVSLAHKSTVQVSPVDLGIDLVLQIAKLRLLLQVQVQKVLEGRSHDALDVDPVRVAVDLLLQELESLAAARQLPLQSIESALAGRCDAIVVRIVVHLMLLHW